MYSYDWITLVTLGLDRWKQDRHPAPQPNAGYMVELDAARDRHLAQLKLQSQMLASEQPEIRRRPTLLKIFQILRIQLSLFEPASSPSSRDPKRRSRNYPVPCAKSSERAAS